jgi:glycerol-3-phosphate responsive antiterminator
LWRKAQADCEEIHRGCWKKEDQQEKEETDEAIIASSFLQHNSEMEQVLSKFRI